MTFQIFGCHFKLSETKNSTLTKLDGDYQEQRLAKKKADILVHHNEKQSACKMVNNQVE